MSIRILGGVAKNFELATPNTSLTRPTSVMLRRRFFDSRQDCSNLHFIDLCAGTGSMGIEALSRGAKLSTMLELNRQVYPVLKKNTEAISKKYPELGESCLISKDYLKWLKSEYRPNTDLEDFLFFDPPYEKKQMYSDFFTWVKESTFKGHVMIEACEQKTMTQTEFKKNYGDPDKSYKQGSSFLFIYHIQ